MFSPTTRSGSPNATSLPLPLAQDPDYRADPNQRRRLQVPVGEKKAAGVLGRALMIEQIKVAEQRVGHDRDRVDQVRASVQGDRLRTDGVEAIRNQRSADTDRDQPVEQR